MRRSIVILTVVLLVFGNGLWAQMRSHRNQPAMYMDDSYYCSTVDTVVPSMPVYDRNAREFIFVGDTTQYPDTVVMRIIER